LEQRVKERTAQLQASEELTRQHLAEIEGYYNVAPIGLAILDRQLRHIRVNEKTAQMDGVPVEDHIGRTLREVAPKNVADWFEAIAPRVLNDGDTITGVEITGGSRLEPDVERMGRLSCFPLRNAMSQIVGVGCTLEDITETRRLEEELRQSHKMEAVGTLAGGIAHDFNNMLAIIMGNAELALDDVQQPEPRRNLEAILGASKRSRDLVKQILTFSRKTGGEQKTLDMGSLLKEIHTLLRSTLPTTIRIRLDIDAARNLIVLGDPTKIQQVILNLAGNAAHAMRKHGGVLTIGLSTLDLGTDSPSNETESGPYVKLTVKDTGTGIPDEIRRRIFEPFFTTKEPGQGTGMGLSVVYGIVKDLNGIIEVESKVGRGTLFTVLFPQAHALAPKQEHEVAAPSGKEHILLVDDEAGFLEVTAMMLKRLGYRVTSTHDSVIAMRHFITSPEAFDLIITDQTMPDFTGIEFAQEVRCIRKNLPIILCTGHSDIVSPETAKEAGIEEFLMKPIRKKELTQAIRRVLGAGKTVPVERTTFQS
jgi:signal transduction histidine kinase/ActR/RegA family two-component response regulator